MGDRGTFLTVDEREIYERIQAGDEGALRELVEANIEDLWPIARSLAKAGGKWSPDDLFQEGALAMIQFAQRWERREGIPFAAACRARVRGAMKDFIRRKADAVRGHIGQPLSLEASNSSGQTLGERLAETPAEEEDALALPTHLSRCEREVLELRVLSPVPLSVAATAKKMGCDPVRVRHLQRRAMRKIQTAA